MQRGGQQRRPAQGEPAPGGWATPVQRPGAARGGTNAAARRPRCTRPAVAAADVPGPGDERQLRRLQPPGVAGGRLWKAAPARGRQAALGCRHEAWVAHLPNACPLPCMPPQQATWKMTMADSSPLKPNNRCCGAPGAGASLGGAARYAAAPPAVSSRTAAATAARHACRSSYNYTDATQALKVCCMPAAERLRLPAHTRRVAASTQPPAAPLPAAHQCDGG